MVNLGFIKDIDNKSKTKHLKIKESKKLAMTCDFQKCGILTSVDLSVASMINYIPDKKETHHLKLFNSQEDHK